MFQWVPAFQKERRKWTEDFINSSFMFRKQQPEEYLKRLADAMLRTPTNSAMTIWLGYFVSDFRPALAVAAFSECLARHPDHAAAHLNLGNCYVDMDRLVDAEYFCRRAVSLDPGLAEAHASLGFLFTSLGRLDEAIAACQAAIRLRPEFAQAHWNLAVAALLYWPRPRHVHWTLSETSEQSFGGRAGRGPA